MENRRSFRWWHAVAIFVAANAFSAMPVGFGGDFNFYNSFLQPSLAPPDWAFAPVWLFLNMTSLIALYRVANSPVLSRGRVVFLWAEGIGWVLFATFTTLYFLLRSPTLGAIDTVAGLVSGVVSLICAASIDRQAAVWVLLRVLWLALASYVSVYVALSNGDPFFGTTATA